MDNPMPQDTPPSHKADRYGWVIVAVMLLVQTVSSGLGFYNMSVYINRLSAELLAPHELLQQPVAWEWVSGDGRRSSRANGASAHQ